MRDELKPQSIDRELNIIVAMFNQAENYFPALDQWRLATSEFGEQRLYQTRRLLKGNKWARMRR
jgi:hypothetical protein